MGIVSLPGPNPNECMVALVKLIYQLPLGHGLTCRVYHVPLLGCTVPSTGAWGVDWQLKAGGVRLGLGR